MKYFQTDDRDDYFASLSKKKKDPFGYTKYTVKEGIKTLIVGDSRECKTFIKNHFGVTGRFVKFGKWKQLAIDKGLTIDEKLIEYQKKTTPKT